VVDEVRREDPREVVGHPRESITLTTLSHGCSNASLAFTPDELSPRAGRRLSRAAFQPAVEGTNRPVDGLGPPPVVTPSDPIGAGTTRTDGQLTAPPPVVTPGVTNRRAGRPPRERGIPANAESLLRE